MYIYIVLRQNYIKCFYGYFEFVYLQFKNRLDKKRAQTPVKCDSCDITLNSDQQAKQHFNGKAHIKRLRKLGLPIPEEHQGKIHAKSGMYTVHCDVHTQGGSGCIWI